ncbi:DEAD/DEAH box helicase, partial [Yaniella sp.]
MVALLPTRQATDLVSGIQDYLTTTFALSDKPAQAAVREFLSDRDNGMFKGPYIRLRLPFQPAQDGWENFLGHHFGEFTPYGHQALAYERLSSFGRDGQRFRRPEPTLVTTGTGSGKTEAFLHPILDHVLRAKREGITGMKALILYPMNALANDQAARLAQLLTTDTRLSGIRAALYTGQKGKDRSRVTADSLITNPQAIQDHTPDILLTNYKMLDQLLLRHNDAPIWEASALSLQYLVLDEFHTYDGAQGTDVAMLLRRLGMTLKSYWPASSDGGADAVTAEDRQRPLGMITPVATSATLGGGDGGEEMLHFAETIFGEKFDEASLITESRMSFAQWQQLSPAGAGLPRGLEELSASISETNRVVEANPSEEEILDTILDALFEQPPEHEPHVMLDALRHHPLTEFLVVHTETARDITELTELLFPRLTGEKELVEAAEFVSHILALYSYVRVATGRLALTVETHLWIRELTRIDAKVDTSLEFRWGDDPVVETEELAQGEAPATYLPAVYCRHCGRYGWGAKLAPTQSELIIDPDEIRQASLTHEADFRVLLEGGAEADEAAREGRSYRSTKAIGLRYFHRQKQTLDTRPPEDDDPDLHRGLIIPVLALDGDEVVEQSQNDVCPACFTEDAIRFVGSAVSTLTSVAIS